VPIIFAFLDLEKEFLVFVQTRFKKDLDKEAKILVSDAAARTSNCFLNRTVWRLETAPPQIDPFGGDEFPRSLRKT
jgi:hypothetical protein